MSLKVEIYGRDSCRFSMAAIAYCATRAYPSVFHDLDDPAVEAQMLRCTPPRADARRPTPTDAVTPQIFIGPHFIGGLISLRGKDAIIQQLLGGHSNEL